MANNRINYFSRYMPNSYGNSKGINVPKKIQEPKIDVSALDSNVNSLNSQAESFKESKIGLNTDKKSIIDNPDKLIGDISNTAESVKSSIEGGSKSGAIGAGAALVGNLVGNQLNNNKREVTGGAIKGATSAAATALTMTANPLIAAGAGIVGGVLGGISGKKQQKDRIKKEQETADWNSRMDKLHKKSLTKADDLAAYRGILSGSKGTTLKYKAGGVLKYNTINIEEALSYLDSLEPKKLLSDSRIFKFGGPVEDIKLSRSLSTTVPTFKRGGPIDTIKTNVIVDGPSHDDTNNTGVKGDKGLPVVKKGKKVAEIESLELVMNSVSSKELKSLVDQYEKTGNEEIKKKIGGLLNKEFKYNTYDYSNIME